MAEILQDSGDGSVIPRQLEEGWEKWKEFQDKILDARGETLAEIFPELKSYERVTMLRSELIDVLESHEQKLKSLGLLGIQNSTKE